MKTPARSRHVTRRITQEHTGSFPRIPVRLPDPSTIPDAAQLSPEGMPNFVSDEQIARQAHLRIAELGETVTGRLVIKVQKGTMYIHGGVQSQYQRLLIASVLRRIRPDLVIRDRIEVAPVRTSVPRLSPRTRLLNWTVRISGVAMLLIVCVSAFCVMNISKNPGLKNVAVSVSANGKIASGAFLTLYPLRIANLDTHPRSQGRVNDQGVVSWTTFEPDDGLLPGEYVVTAIWNRTVEIDGEFQPGPNILRQIYESPDTSPIRLTVNANPHAILTEPVVLSFE